MESPEETKPIRSRESPHPESLLARLENSSAPDRAWPDYVAALVRFLGTTHGDDDCRSRTRWAQSFLRGSRRAISVRTNADITTHGQHEFLRERCGRVLSPSTSPATKVCPPIIFRKAPSSEN